jgi:hypothetical protein
VTRAPTDETSAAAVLAAKESDLHRRVVEAYRGWERFALLEIVRAADHAAVLQRFSTLDDSENESQSYILRGIAPALAAILPHIGAAEGGGIPFGPTRVENARFIDSYLHQIGLLSSR